MKCFQFELPSTHSPKDLWAAINTPIQPGELNDRLHKGARIEYSGLDQDGLIMTGSHIVTVISSIQSRKLQWAKNIMGEDCVPDQIAVNADVRPSRMLRTDTFDQGQVAEGILHRTVEEGENNTGLLVMEGKIAIMGYDDIWPGFFGDINDTAIYGLVRKPNEKIIANVPAILAQ